MTTEAEMSKVASGWPEGSPPEAPRALDLAAP